MSRALVAAGHRVVIATGKAPGCPELEEGPCGTIHRFYGRNEIYGPTVTQRVLELARLEKVDWIECADHLGEGARLMRCRNRPPVILKVHGSNVIRVVRESEVLHAWQRLVIPLALMRNGRQFLAERNSLRLADRVLVPSQRLFQELVKQGLRTADAMKVLPNPISLHECERQEAQAPTLLMVGRISIGKGIQYLPALMRSLVFRFPDVRLEIAGGDSYARGLGALKQWLVSQLGDLRDRVDFLGVLGPEQLQAAYRRAWVLALPSRWDNFPNAVLDAMIHGVPVLASPHGGMPEMLAGTGCPIADPATPEFARQAEALLADSALRHRVGQAARARALGHYHPAKIAQEYVDIVARSIGK
jgi:glycosyltransferase involved in cell wall biosynthesis